MRELTEWLDNVGNLLSSVLRWLEHLDEDEKWWQLQTQVAQLCLLELEMKFRITGPSGRILHSVHEMVDAMRTRNRPRALESGARALEQLSQIGE